VPLAQRQRALGQGTLAVLGAVPGFIGFSWLLNALSITQRTPLLLGFLLCFTAVIYGVWKLGQARDGRWDGWGLIALAVLILGYPLLFVLTGGVAMALVSLFTGQPVRLFGD
jgi:hypothetical protein